jgi:two-component system sensor histidine kinase CpxA
MMRATAEIAEGRFNIHITNTRKDELGNLSASINQVAKRLEKFTNGQQRFLRDIAHELRSPVARLQIAVGILEQQTTSISSQAVEDLRLDIDTISGLIDELFTFARARSLPQPQMVATNVSDVVRRAVKAEVRDKVEICVDVDPSIYVKADPEFLFRSIANILRNAVHYSSHGDLISCAAAKIEGKVFVTISDSGPGVPEDELEKIFTPFYRVESSGDRTNGGSGLGLAIVQTCIHACQGSVSCRNRKPRGLEVTVELRAGEPNSYGKEAHALQKMFVSG